MPEVKIGNRMVHSVKLDRRRLRDSDLVLILARENDVDWGLIAEQAKHVFDTNC